MSSNKGPRPSQNFLRVCLYTNLNTKSILTSRFFRTQRLSSAHARLYRKLSASIVPQIVSSKPPSGPEKPEPEAPVKNEDAIAGCSKIDSDSKLQNTQPYAWFAPLASYSTWRAKLRARGLRRLDEQSSDRATRSVQSMSEFQSSADKNIPARDESGVKR